MPNRTQPISLQLGSANDGLTLSLDLRDTSDNPVSGSSFDTVQIGPNAGDYYTAVNHPDTFGGGFVVVSDSAGPTEIARFAIGAAPLLPTDVQLSTEAAPEIEFNDEEVTLG
jgi:hypothetical protein